MSRPRPRTGRRSALLALPLTAAALASCLAASPGRAVASAASPPRGATDSCPAGEVSTYSAPELAGVSCRPVNQPETAAEKLVADTQLARRSAPDTSVAPGAHASALEQTAAIAALNHRLAGTDGTWAPYGQGPLIGSDPKYTRVALAGEGDAGGRVNHYVYDSLHQRLYASVGQGGVWALDKGSTTWRSVGDTLATQAVGGLGWSPDGGGTLLVTTGNDVFGGGTTFAGVGAFRSTDDGRTWVKARGIPDGVNSFQVAVDPVNPRVAYAATGAGLFRTDDAGVSYANVKLPVSPAGTTPNCTGALPTVEGCFLANVVTDVVVRTPGGVGADKTGGAVIAAVGWRAGAKHNTSKSYSDYVEAPGNGIYASATGAIGSFTNITGSGPTNFADGEQTKIGRIELGATTGDTQDHSYLYALVQDATGFQGGSEVFGIDVPLPAQAVAAKKVTTYLKGVYVSPDFGLTWTKLAVPAEHALPTTGSATIGLACDDPRQFYCPGAQAWYDMWIKPDPTRATSAGVPTRLVFGLEELWQNQLADQTTIGTNVPQNFNVIAAYVGGTQCLFLVLGFPACPTQASYGSTSPHPDHHDGIFIPDGRGGVTIFTGNDGGVFSQHVDAGQAFSNANWGRGVNSGFNTLMPYGAVMAKDGTVYAGLQDNGELRVDPKTGKQYNMHDGDGTTSAVDPDNSNIIFERPAGAALQKSTDGGATWTAVSPTDTWQFNNPISMDPANSNHILDAGTKVWESTTGGGASTAWTQVFDLGLSAAGVTNSMSALDVRGVANGKTLPTGPHTANFTYSDGGATVPGAVQATANVFPPGTYVDHPFTIGSNDGDASVKVDVTWADPTNDWDAFLYHNENGTLVQLDSSVTSNATTGDPSEHMTVQNPPPGDYVIRIANATATGTFNVATTFTQRSTAVAAQGVDVAYVAFCGQCDALNARPFDNGIATNVGGSKPGNPGTTDGWHVAKASGLPKRFITSIASDPSDPRTVYVTLAGYSRRWLPVGAAGEPFDPRAGNVFKSTDAGEHFTNISGNLPDGPAESSVLHNGNLIVATDTGVFMSAGSDGGTYELLGKGLPNAPVFSVALKPKASAAEQDTLYVATHGRSVYTYHFATAGKVVPPTVLPTATPNTSAAPGSAIPAIGILALLGSAAALVVTVRRRRTGG